MQYVEQVDKCSVQVRAHEALQSVHNMGILHGDVALRNFVVDNECQVKVIDFGRASVLDVNEPKVQELFNREHKQLDLEFAEHGYKVLADYHEQPILYDKHSIPHMQHESSKRGAGQS